MLLGLERTVTFIVGILFIGLGLFLWPNEVLVFWMIISILCLLIGIYFMIAALVPHKRTVQDVSDETLSYLLIELPLRLIVRALGKVGDIF